MIPHIGTNQISPSYSALAFLKNRIQKQKLMLAKTILKEKESLANQRQLNPTEKERKAEMEKEVTTRKLNVRKAEGEVRTFWNKGKCDNGNTCMFRDWLYRQPTPEPKPKPNAKTECEKPSRTLSSFKSCYPSPVPFLVLSLKTRQTILRQK